MSVPKQVPLAVSSCLSTWMTLTWTSRTDLKATHRCTRLSNTKMRTFQWQLLWSIFCCKEVLTQGIACSARECAQFRNVTYACHFSIENRNKLTPILLVNPKNTELKEMLERGTAAFQMVGIGIGMG